ncbi:MAG TPA: sulfocyanin-like copper-binding protein [Gaiellaceae bacterium]|nr:sulfocyanin-like copper-binding protein [Gaiellaceae bacterium]
MLAAQHPSPAQFLHVDAKQRTALVTLIAGYNGENNGFNFDGYGRGEMFVTVPRGWRVRVTCTNHGGLNHSCAVVKGPMTITPAFRGAATPILPSGATTHFSFVASRVGSYRIACLVPGHEEARMWDVLEVTAGGKPSISARAGP